MAYSISLEQYNKLVCLLQKANPMDLTSGILCYQFSNNTSSSTESWKFRLSEIERNGDTLSQSKQEDNTLIAMHRFSLENNNCRHMAIAIVKYILDVQTLPGNVSSKYLDELPFHAEFNEGRPIAGNSFHVFPLPPENYDQTNVSLKKLYKFLCTAVKNNEQFQRASELYIYLASHSLTESSNSLISYTQQWQLQHANLYISTNAASNHSMPSSYFKTFLKVFPLYSAPTIDDILNEIVLELAQQSNNTPSSLPPH